MWRYKVMIKGSEKELAWLNQLAQRGQLLQRIHGDWYQFKATSEKYRLFSEYVTNDVATEIQEQTSPFEVLTTLQLKDPEVQVIYTGSTQVVLQQARVDQRDAPLQLKIALAQRGHFLNIMNTILFVGLGLLIVLILTNNISENIGGLYVLLWLLIGGRPALQARRIHKESNELRMITQQYDDAWRPTMHVFLKNMVEDLDTEKVASLGAWSFVGKDHKGMSWYDVRTLASESEIKQTVQKVVGPDVTVTIVSWLGLAPLVYI